MIHEPNHSPESARFPRWVGFVALGIPLLTALPYLSLWLTTDPGRVYLGMKTVNSADFLTYVAWMRQAGAGELAFRNLYTAESTQSDIYLPLMWLFGKASAAMGVGPILGLHALRILSGIALLLTIWWFVGTYFSGGSRGRAFLLLGLGTGLPGLVPEASPVSSIYDSAVSTTAWTVMLIAFGLFRIGMERGSTPHLVGAGLAGAVLAVIHPYDAVPLGIVIALSGLAPVFEGGLGPRIARAAVTAGLMLPGVAFTAWHFLSNPLLSEWAAVPRPFSWWGLLSFGVLWLGAGHALSRHRGRTGSFVLVWLVVQLTLLLIPSPIARKLIQGLQAPIAIAATVGFEAWIAGGRERFARLAEVTIYPAAVLMLLLDATYVLPQPQRLPRTAFADIQALGDLPEGVIFSSPGLSYYVPPLSGRQVYCGNYGLTIGWEEKLHHWDHFLQGDLAASDLRARGIDWVLAGNDTVLPAEGLTRYWTGEVMSLWSLEPQPPPLPTQRESRATPGSPRAGPRTSAAAATRS